MYPPGSGYPPTISGFSSTCDATTGTSIVTFSVNKQIGGATCGVTITDNATGNTVFSDSFTVNVQSYSLPNAAGAPTLPNGVYTLEADNGENSATVGFEVDCLAATCDLVITSVTPYPPTSPGGFGYVEIRYTTSDAYVNFSITGVVNRQYGVVKNDGVVYAQLLPAGGYSYTISRQSDPTCVASADFVIDPAPAPVDPSLNDPARWEPVGGVLPNPVLLKVEASLTDANGAARAGLHVEVELWRPAAAASFVTFRATVRQAVQYVDAAPYLREQLVALHRYAATASSPLIDADASLRFYYRYRAVDKAGPEQWLTRAGERYAVLAALPEAADTMAPYVADTVGKVASVFPDFEGAQFVGLPLEATVLLPPPTPGQDRWAELRYLDAYRNEVEIRSFALAATLPAGVLRIPLPANVLPCAAYVEVSVRDDNRAYVGTCGGPVVPPFPTPGNLLVNGGYLKL